MFLLGREWGVESDQKINHQARFSIFMNVFLRKYVLWFCSGVIGGDLIEIYLKFY